MNLMPMPPKWTDENARLLYEALSEEVRRVIRNRSVALGVSIQGDTYAAEKLMSANRRLSQRERDEIWQSYQPIIDGLIERMTDIFNTYTTPQLLIPLPPDGKSQQ